MGDHHSNGNSPVLHYTEATNQSRSRSRSFYLVDSTTHQPFFADDQMTVFSGADHGNLTPISEKGGRLDNHEHQRERSDEGPREPDNVNGWHSIRAVYQDAICEFFGVLILIMFGDGSVAQITLARGANGTWQSIPFAWGIGVMLGAYVARRSGAHLNPAVTLCFCIFRKFSWKKLPVYALAQILGAMVGAAIVYGNYKSAFDNFAGHNTFLVPGQANVNQSLVTAGIFSTYPAPYLSSLGQFFSEVVASAVLLFCVFAILDEGNIGAGPFLPIGLFFIIFGIGSSFGVLTGFAINPARDFGPRLMSYMIGFGTSVWTVGHHYFWVPIIGPVVGTIVGGFLYDFFIFHGESPVNILFTGSRKPKRREQNPV